jgi:hypothetical protein
MPPPTSFVVRNVLRLSVGVCIGLSIAVLLTLSLRPSVTPRYTLCEFHRHDV